MQKLVLHRETLRQLTTGKLAEVRGGAGTQNGPNCNTGVSWDKACDTLPPHQ